MDETQDATSNNVGCPQSSTSNEDCLSVNIYTPQVKCLRNQNQPYIVK